MSAVTFDFYQSEYGGKSIKAEDWNRLSARATSRLEFICGVFLPDDMEAAAMAPSLIKNISMCICEMAEAFQTIDAQGQVKSESTDGYSVSYAEQTAYQQNQKLYGIALSWLGNTGLMYVGTKQYAS